jgi:hypothetical protein
MIHSHNIKSILDYHQWEHNLEIYNCRPTIAGGTFYNRLPAHIKQIKDNLLFRRQLKQFLIKGCYYSVEEYMCDDFTRKTNYQYWCYKDCYLTVVYIFIYLY